MGRKPTIEQKVDLSLKQGRLAARIAEHQRKAARFLRSSEDQDTYDFEGVEVFVDGEDGEVALEQPQVDPFKLPDGPVPEKLKLALPSAMSERVRKERRLASATDQEIQLREGQCNDALQGIRLALGKKAFLFRTQVRQGGAKTGKTRPWDAIHSADASLREHAQIYRTSRGALEKLKPPRETLEKYRPLDVKDLKTSTTLLDTSNHGQKHDTLPWFWYLDVAGDMEAADQMTECGFLLSTDGLR